MPANLTPSSPFVFRSTTETAPIMSPHKRTMPLLGFNEPCDICMAIKKEAASADVIRKPATLRKMTQLMITPPPKAEATA